MGLGKAFKKIAGKSGLFVEDVTGSKFLGRAAAMAVGGAGGSVAGSPAMAPGIVAGSSGFSSVKRAEINKEINSTNQIQQLQQTTQQLEEEKRRRSLLEADLQEQIQQERKRTTFAGSSMQGLYERKRLLGV